MRQRSLLLFPFYRWKNWGLRAEDPYPDFVSRPNMQPAHFIWAFPVTTTYYFLKALLLLFSCPVMSDSLQPHGHQPSLSLTISQSLPKFMSIASVMPYTHLILWHPLLLLSLIFPRVRDFSSEWAVGIRWPKYWSFHFSISVSSEYSELISLKIDWLELLAVQGTFRSLLQHHGLKASIIWRSAFFKVQLLQPYLTTGKAVALTIRTFVGRVMSLLFRHLNTIYVCLRLTFKGLPLA